MTTRRAPLANVPNAINSPYRPVAPVSGKRTRAQAGEGLYGQPPAKKQIIEAGDDGEENVDPKRRNGIAVNAQNNLEEPFTKQRINHAPTALTKKFAAVKKAAPPPRADRSQKHQADLESIRQWQKHYRRQFPQFVFYFDSVSEDVRAKSMRQIHALGGVEERFFSKAVTHVVTTRAIPAEPSSTSPVEGDNYKPSPSKSLQQSAVSQEQKRTMNLLDANLQRRSQQTNTTVQTSLESRRPHTQNVDILSRARAMRIKIWTLEKLHRVLGAILDGDAGDHTHDLRDRFINHVSSKQTQDADLEKLLRHEKVNGPTDRDMTVATQDMTQLRGCYIYIHDMDERTKPVMVRDYPKPVTKDQGKWPQFKLSGQGRCPFVEDPTHTKKLQQQERDTQTKTQQDRVQKARLATLPIAPTQPLAECEANLRRSPRKIAQVAKPLDPPTVPPAKRHSSAEMPPLFGSTQAGLRAAPRMVRGEPVASGIQHSNVTSAIRSQAISSAAISSTAPGLSRRFGDSKEVSRLKRKVLASNNSIPSSYVNPNDMRAALNDSQDPPPRAAKRKAQETLGVVVEDDVAAGQRSRAMAPAPKKSKVQKEAKPGYCENCRDKYDDFDDHVVSRKHRKFATSHENWKELDNLLLQLKRPRKKQ